MLPRLSDSTAAPLFATLSDRQRFLEKPQFTMADVGPLIDMCNSITAITMGYLKAPVVAAPSEPGGGTPPPAMLSPNATVMNNSVTYQDELVPLLDFQMRCLGQAIPFMETLASSAPPGALNSEAMAGLRQMRQGLQMTYMGLTTTGVQPGITDRSKTVLYDGIMSVTPNFAMSMDIPTRSQILLSMQTLKAALPEPYNAQIRRIMEQIAVAPCGRLCSL